MAAAVWALTWELWWPYRRLLAASGTYFAALALLAYAVPNDPSLGGIGCGSAALIIFCELAVFAHGTNGVDFEGAKSCFPARQLTLPVPTGLLVACPMVAGTVAVALTWVALARFVLRPSGLEVALWAPALTLATLLGWLQAAAWSPLPVPWVRLVFVVSFAVGELVAVTAVGVGKLSPAVFFSGGLLLLAAAYAVARAGVARARRGEGELSAWFVRLVAALAKSLPRRRRPFASPARAQLWLEWRRHGVIVPLFVASYGAIDLAMSPLYETGAENLAGSGMFPAFNAALQTVGLPALIVLVLSLLPPLCGVTGTDLGNTEGKAYAMSSFLATRPVTSGALVLAKFRVAALNTLVAWAVLGAEILAWMLCTGNAGAVARGIGALLPRAAAARTGAVAFVVFALTFVTWKHQVENLFLVLTGRARLVIGGMISGLALLIGACVCGSWLYRHAEYHALFWSALPWFLGSAVLLKAAAAGWSVRELLRHGILDLQTAGLFAAAWSAVAAVLFGGLWGLLPAGLVPVPYLAAGVCLTVPLARLAAAPLALEWNRHR